MTNAKQSRVSKSKKFAALLGFLLLFINGAMATKVKVDWDKSADFTKYRTYAWARGTPASNPLIDRRIVAAVDSELAAQGFQKVDSPENADLLIIYHAAVGSETQLNTTSLGSGWGWQWGGGTSTRSVDRIPIGQLVVNIGDARSKKILWMGNASDTLSDNPERNIDRFREAISEMFKSFPPPKTK